MNAKRVLLIGIDPALVQFSPAGGRSAASVAAAGASAAEQLAAQGYAVEQCLVDLGETAEAAVVRALSGAPFDCVMIGAGLRALPQHTLLFERVINAVHRHAPAAALCFNTNPNDTAEAVRRWV